MADAVQTARFHLATGTRAVAAVIEVGAVTGAQPRQRAARSVPVAWVVCAPRAGQTAARTMVPVHAFADRVVEASSSRKIALVISYVNAVRLVGPIAVAAPGAVCQRACVCDSRGKSPARARLVDLDAQLREGTVAALALGALSSRGCVPRGRR